MSQYLPAPEPGLPKIPSDAFCIHSAAELLITSLKDGTVLTAEMMRFAMEDAFGASDTNGATAKHRLSALARLTPGERLVAINSVEPCSTNENPCGSFEKPVHT